MLLFTLPFVAVALVILGVIGYLLWLPLDLFIKPASINRFGPPSSTRFIGQAVLGGFSRAFDFSGRANRLDFWAFAVFAGGVCLLPPAIVVVSACLYPAASIWSLSSALIWPLMAVPCLSMAVRRLHDVNRSGWRVLMVMVFGYLNLLYWFLQTPRKSMESVDHIFD